MTTTDMFKVCLMFFIQASQEWKRTNGYQVFLSFTNIYVYKEGAFSFCSCSVDKAVKGRTISLLAKIQYIYPSPPR